jgi:anti-sigma B factor antagonist
MNFTLNSLDDVLIIGLEGDLIGEDTGLDLVEKATTAISEGTLRCIIDISKVRYINSSGIGVLITLLTKFRNKGGDLILVNPSETVSKLLIITKLNAIFTIAASQDEAIQSLR